MNLNFPGARQLAAFLAITTAGMFVQREANAQLTLSGNSYVQNFDSLANGLPVGWSVDSGATTSSIGVSSAFTATATVWNSVSKGFKNVASYDAFVGNPTATATAQAAATNRALGLRQTGSFDSTQAFELTLANTNGLSNFVLDFDLQSLDSNSLRVTTWQVDYGTGTNPNIFTIPATATYTGDPLATGGNSFKKIHVHANFANGIDNTNAPVVIRIVALGGTVGSGTRATTGIDSVVLTWTGGVPAPTNIALVQKTPTGNNVPLATNQLKLKFNNPIASATGIISLFKAGNATPVIFAVPSGAVTIADSTATINGVSLANNSSYYVQMTAGTFTKSDGTLPSLAIADSTSWIFKTVDTVMPPPPTPLTSLNETFTNCISTAMGDFTQYSSAGIKTWKCSTFGHTDSAAVYINAGSAVGVSEKNNDWLISSAPFNFSAMSKPVLSFWQKRRFDGNVTRTLKISTNYVNGSDPATATWTTVSVPDFAQSPTINVWSQVQNIDLTAYKATPFYLAFTYTCDTNGAYELTYDDIQVVNMPVSGIFAPSKGSIGIKVLGEALPNRINLGIDLTANADLNIQMYDMTGRIVCQQALKGRIGNQTYAINPANIAAGTYVVRVLSGSNYGAVKVSVQ